MKWIYGRQDWKTLERGLENCYLLTNGLGGFSSLTMTGAVARNDHSVFMSCTKAPNHRINMIHRMKEELDIGESKYVLSTQEFADGTKEEGYRYLTEFSFEILPSWRYLINGIEIEKEIVMAQGSNQIAVNYHLKNRGQKEAALCVTPFFQFEPKGEDLKEDKIFSRQAQKITDGKYALFFETNGETEEFQEKKETYFYRYDECDGRRENGTASAVYQIKKRVKPGEETDLTVIYSLDSWIDVEVKSLFDKMKEEQIKKLFDDAVDYEYTFEPIKGSPIEFAYRNKMEFSFGDEYKDGPLSLGLHKKGSTYDVLNAEDCKLVHEDMDKILSCVLHYFRERGVSYYHKMQHTGYLRHLLLRRGSRTGEILVNLVTTSQEEYDLEPLKEALLALNLEGSIVGILHIINDSLSDVVKSDETRLLYGQDYFYEELLELRFKITPFSFFQPNSRGAEILYQTVREYIGDTKDKVVFDLYSGTGTIAQIAAAVAKQVIGVEIIPEAVEAAKENAAMNGITNCTFLADDVLKALDYITEKPDLIILDPPRDGVHPKALPKILDYGVERIVYISCKPSSLARDLAMFEAKGYRMEKCVAVDQFCQTVHVETVVLLQRKNM